MNRAIENTEPHVAQVGEPKLVQSRIVEIDDAITTPTYQVMVMIGVAVESRHGLEVVGSFGESKVDESFKRPIDRGARDTRNTVLHVFKHLIHCRVVVAVKEHVQDDTTLHCYWKTPLSALDLKKLQLSLFIYMGFSQLSCSSLKTGKLGDLQTPLSRLQETSLYYAAFETGKPSPSATPLPYAGSALAKCATCRS